MTIIPNRHAQRARVTPGRSSAFTRHALSLLSTTSAPKNSAEYCVQLKEKAFAKPSIVASLEKQHAHEASNSGIRPHQSAHNRKTVPSGSRLVALSMATTFSKL